MFDEVLGSIKEWKLKNKEMKEAMKWKKEKTYKEKRTKERRGEISLKLIKRERSLQEDKKNDER